MLLGSPAAGVFLRNTSSPGSCHSTVLAQLVGHLVWGHVFCLGQELSRLSSVLSTYRCPLSICHVSVYSPGLLHAGLFQFWVLWIRRFSLYPIYLFVCLFSFNKSIFLCSYLALYLLCSPDWLSSLKSSTSAFPVLGCKYEPHVLCIGKFLGVFIRFLVIGRVETQLPFRCWPLSHTVVPHWPDAFLLPLDFIWLRASCWLVCGDGSTCWKVPALWDVTSLTSPTTQFGSEGSWLLSWSLCSSQCSCAEAESFSLGLGEESVYSE